MQNKGKNILEIKIITDFLNKEEADDLELKIGSRTFPWGLFPNFVDLDIPGYEDSKNNGCFLRHTFYDGKNDQKTEHAVFLKQILENIIKEFNDKEMIFLQIAANATLRNEEFKNQVSPPHVDLTNLEKELTDNYDFYTALYYVNDCDGDTTLYNKVHEYIDYDQEYRFNSKEISNPLCKITPKKGTFAYWDARFYHSAPASASKTRYVINFNFGIKKQTEK